MGYSYSWCGDNKYSMNKIDRLIHRHVFGLRTKPVPRYSGNVVYAWKDWDIAVKRLPEKAYLMTSSCGCNWSWDNGSTWVREKNPAETIAMASLKAVGHEQLAKK